jgi:hypothetical protein
MSETFEPALLPDVEKRELCESLLREFGVTRWRSTSKGELIHSCPIPGGHRNGDRNPSASLNWKKLTFNCLGCGSRGGLLYFMARCRGEDAESVREWLSEATGTGGHTMELGRLLEVVEALLAPSAPPPGIARFPIDTLKPWTSWPIHHPYLTDPLPDGRACRPETLTRFRVGYADAYYMGEHAPTQERIVIPIFWKGDLVGWQARRLAPWDEPKYKNSVEFPRDRVIYNHHTEREALVVESPLSVLRHHHHLPELCSTLGANVTEIQVRHLHRYDRVILWFDNDTAGWEATERVGDALGDYVDVWAVESPYDCDPADLPDATVEELKGAAVPYSIWQPPKKLISWNGAS